jgi:hypothetical protein
MGPNNRWGQRGKRMGEREMDGVRGAEERGRESEGKK